MSLKPSEAWKLWKALYKSIGARDLLEILLKNHDKEQVTVQLVNKLTAGIQKLLPVSERRSFEAPKPGSRLPEPPEEVLVERRRRGATKPTKPDSLAAVNDDPKRISGMPTTSIGETSVKRGERQPSAPQALIDMDRGGQRPEDESHGGVEPAQRRVSGRSGARTKYPSDGSDVQIRATLPAAPRAAEILPKATSAEVDKAATGKTTKKQTRLKTSTQRAGAGGTSDSCEGRTRMDDPTNAEKRIFKNNTRRTCNWDNIASAIEALLPRGEEFSFDSSWGDLGTLYKVWAKEHTYEGNRDKMLCADSNWKPSKGEIEAKYEEYKKSAAPKIRNDLQSIEEALDLPQGISSGSAKKCLLLKKLKPLIPSLLLRNYDRRRARPSSKGMSNADERDNGETSKPLCRQTVVS
ncbi:hypothetical protein E5D57_011109 [Metarhizium anisopliae]|nr:hypothetical protein E5D57_014016 [Metarhizium anisopliae]KAF5120977.1 hypothetical protein E5D57_013313 [Metarhizium anisopliae]KAF5126412.1 hypothetical protein E5D57_011109 [Metarhizium anisopliae]